MDHEGIHLIDQFLTSKASKTETALRSYLTRCSDAPSALREAIEYSLFAGGKRLRPALALGAAELVSGNDAPALPVACALEMIHTYSLIHDDLPSMDNDDLRRGKPTLHKVYGEAVAILAGDALLTLAFEAAADCGSIRVMREIAQAAGMCGMVGGQVIDIESEHRRLGVAELRKLHAKKTGALIRVSVRAGAMVAGAAESQLGALTQYGEAIGLAFQIADDILDVVGDEVAIGKPVGSDEARQKSTYPAVIGLDGARKLASEAIADAVNSLAEFGPKADTFRALARFIIERDH
ncbi:MAG: polyprenyl synthetase family protein [Candidatus Hydrogenedentes bacterium]|nr:polyprenyl synthetase family protein [Candidatus Hydrogenedentota bacterium]